MTWAEQPSRRQLLIAGGAAALTGGLIRSRLLAEEPRAFPLGICDWTLGRSYDPSVFSLAKEIGLDGVQVSFGAEDVAHDLRTAAARDEFARAAQQHGLQICSLGMGILNDVPYADDERAERWVAESIEVAGHMRLNPRIVLLAFFGKGDLRDDPARQNRVIQRLKRIGPAAERAGVVLGLESWLNVDDHLRILDAVASPALLVYYDVANMTERGYDVVAEVRRLGRDRICQIHAKENGNLLGQGNVDFRQLKRVLDEIGWHGWLVIEGATTAGRSLVDCQRLNQQYLRSLFPGTTPGGRT